MPPHARFCEARTRYGDYPVQPMLTWWHVGDKAQILDQVAALKLPVIRVKIEALLSAGPETLTDPDEYWEFHAKIRNADWAKAATICATGYGAHLFWNGAKFAQPPVPIIALRRYLCSKAEAVAAMDQLQEELAAAGFPTDERHSEYGVLDTNPALDGGWMFRSGGSKSDFLFACM